MVHWLVYGQLLLAVLKDNTYILHFDNFKCTIEHIILYFLQEQTKNTASPVGTFSTYISSDTLLNTGATLIFTDIVYNSGEYNPSLGSFQWPVSGVYLFFIAIGNAWNYPQLGVRLMIDSTIIRYVFSGYSTGQHQSGSDAIVVHCMALQEVKVVVDSTSSGALYAAGNYNSFSGMLIHTDPL